MDNSARDFAQKIIVELGHIKRLMIGGLSEQGQQYHGPNRSQGSTSRSNTEPGIAHAEPTRETDDTKDRHQKSFPTLRRLKPLIEVTGVIFLVIYTGVTLFLWFESRKANRIALDALEHNRVSFQREQRAWVRVKHATFGRIKMNTIIPGWPLTISNVGKSPALSIFAHAVFEVIDKKSAPSFSYDKPHSAVEMSILFPSDENSFPAQTGPDANAPIPISQIQVENLLSGNSYLAVFGQVVYTDQFGSHWTRFCAWQSFEQDPSNFNASSCVTYNSVGDGEPPEPLRIKTDHNK